MIKNFETNSLSITKLEKITFLNDLTSQRQWQGEQNLSNKASGLKTKQ